MEDLIASFLSLPLANLFIITGLLFLGISIVGNIQGKISPGKGGRILGGLLGVVLLGMGLNMYSTQTNDSQPIIDMPANTPSMDMPILISTPTETIDPNPKMKKENITNFLKSSSFDRSLRNLALEQYSSDDYISRTEFVYSISLNQSRELIWHWYWCTKDQPTLIQNFQYIGVAFTLNGEDVPLDSLVEDQYYSDTDLWCRVYYVTLFDWPAGTHHLTNTITFSQPINDGWNIYPAQQRTYNYIVYFNP